MLGVWVGGYAQSRKEEQRLDRVDQNAREARLLELKRECYEQLVEEMNRVGQAVVDWDAGGARKVMPPRSSIQGFYDVVAKVQVLGSRDVAHAADQLSLDVDDLFFHGVKDLQVSANAEVQVVNAIRRDLGLPDQVNPPRLQLPRE